MDYNYYSSKDLKGMDKRFRVNFINSLSGFKSLNLAGTINLKSKSTNLAPVSSVIHVGANPPLIGMLMRPNSVPRHTLMNIEDHGYWTLNHVAEEFFEQAHQCSARYSREESEFSKTGLTEEYGNFPAPYVKESKIKIGLKLAEKIDLKVNGTHLLIGKILEVIIPDETLKTDGFIDIEKAGTITCSGLDSYHSTKIIKRLKYAKP